MVKWVMPEEARNYKVLKVIRKQLPKFSFSSIGEYKSEKDVLYSAEEPSVVLGVLVWVGHPDGWSIEGGVEITARAYWGEEGCVPIFRRYLHKHDFHFSSYSSTEGWGYGFGGGWNTEDAKLVRLVPWTILIEEEENLYYHRDAKILSSPSGYPLPVEAWDVDIYLYLAQK